MQAGLLALDLPRVPCQVAVTLEEDAEVRVHLDERACDSVPDGTGLAVVNAEGETVPLATQEAAEIISTGDPMWCPTGVPPIPSTGGCTASFGSFNGGGGLLAVLAGKTAAGTIWIAASYVGTIGLEGGPVTINGGALGTTKDYALTVKGDGQTITYSNSAVRVVPEMGIFSCVSNVITSIGFHDGSG